MSVSAHCINKIKRVRCDIRAEDRSLWIVSPSESHRGKSFYKLWNWKSSASSIDSSKNWICECSTSWWSFQTALLPRPEYYRKYHRIKKVGCCGLVLQIESFQDETLDSVDSVPDKTLHNMPRAQTRHTCAAELSRGNGQILCFTTTLLPRTAEILARIELMCTAYLPTDRTPLTSRMIQSLIPQNIVWCDRLMKHSPYHYYSFGSSLDDVLCKIGCKWYEFKATHKAT